METNLPLDSNETGVTLKDAGNGVRFANMIIDIIAYYIIVFIISVGLAMLGVIGIETLQNPVFSYGLALGVYFLYYMLLEGFSGRTLGKLITGTKAVTQQGEKLSFGKAAGRTLCRFIPFEAFSFLGGVGSGWHDSITKTRVIKIR